MTAIFVDGVGAGAAPSGLVTQLQGRIFALLYLEPEPMSLDDIAASLQQSKSNISTTIRGLVEWHLVRRVAVGGSRKDHYEAATDFWRVMQEIMERRFRWNLRQVLATIDETSRALGESSRSRPAIAAVQSRLDALRAFFSAVDAGIGAFNSGKAFAAETLQNVVRLVASRAPRRN